jgi:hypothetical protein
MKNRFLLLAAAVGMPAMASAGDVGLGVSLDHDPHILLPINVSETVRIEPFIDITKDESDLGGGVQGQFDAKELGLGVFLRSALDDRAGLYYGVRYSKLEGETTVTDSGGAVLFESEDDGDNLALVLGGEYAVGNRLLIGVEAFWFRLSIDSDDGAETTTQETSGTDTRVVVRFMF